MSGRGRGGSVGGQQYSNVGRGGGRGGGRGSRGGRGGGRDGGRGSGRSPAAYNDPQRETDYQSSPAPAYSVSALSRDVATKVNIQSSGTASGSSQPSSSSVSVSPPARPQEVESSVQKHTPPPASSKAMRFPSRPGFGTVGRKCIVRANHFLVQLDVNKDIHHYDVTITPEIPSKKLSRRIIGQLVSDFKQSHLGNRILAYDGRKSAYTAGPLPFKSKEFEVTLPDDANARKKREFKISIKFAAKADLHHLIEFLNRNQVDAPQETIQALDVALRDTPSAIYETVGRSFFSPSLGSKGPLGEGLEYWKGFYQSLRPAQMGLSLNIDISARPFYEPILVTEFIAKYLNIRNLTKPLSPQDLVKVKRALRGLIVESNHLGYVKRQKVLRFSDSLLKDLSFPLDNNEGNMSVVQYFRQRYDSQLQYKFLPTFQFGTDSRPTYLPLEICKLAENQRYTRKLSTGQVTALLKATCERPRDRENNINMMVMRNRYNDNIVAKEFGIQVRPELTSVNARVLPRPMLKYNESGKESRVDPMVGQWNMRDKKMVNGGKVEYWTCVSFSRSGLDAANSFCDMLVNMCCSKGMVFSPSFLPFQSGHPSQIEQCLVRINDQSIAKFKSLGLGQKHLQLLIVILPDIKGSYGTIKRVCETKLGLVSQCCQPKQIFGANIQYLENVALKINVKVGGRNTVLEQAVHGRIPFLTDVPTIVFGADVTHPAPGEASSPSIAAVVGSMDWPEVTKYRGLVSAQQHRQEIIQDLYKKFEDPQKGVVHAGMIRELLLAFYRSTSQKPHRIIFYRDGVSEGQFNQVLFEEMDAIRKACASLQVDYQPRVTFVVVQKRHHTRLFPANHSDRSSTDKSGNILPGTVVDTMICHPMEFDFFLCSHAGIKGTSRPTHYHVLYDENKFSADALQMLTNNLCYTYARCTRSVSIVPPAYYAHLAAFRARYYIEGETSTDGSVPESASREGDVEIHSLPSIMENVKDVMFYC